MSTAQERIDDGIFRSLISKKEDPYPDASTSEDVKIKGFGLLSNRWIMFYYQARTAGVACLYSASYYASMRMIELLKNHSQCRLFIGQTLDQMRAWDCQILYRAQLQINKQKQAKAKPELVEA